MKLYGRGYPRIMPWTCNHGCPRSKQQGWKQCNCVHFFALYSKTMIFRISLCNLLILFGRPYFSLTFQPAPFSHSSLFLVVVLYLSMSTFQQLSPITSVSVRDLKSAFFWYYNFNISITVVYGNWAHKVRNSLLIVTSLLFITWHVQRRFNFSLPNFQLTFNESLHWYR